MPRHTRRRRPPRQTKVLKGQGKWEWRKQTVLLPPTQLSIHKVCFPQQNHHQQEPTKPTSYILFFYFSVDIFTSQPKPNNVLTCSLVDKRQIQTNKLFSSELLKFMFFYTFTWDLCTRKWKRRIVATSRIRSHRVAMVLWWKA